MELERVFTHSMNVAQRLWRRWQRVWWDWPQWARTLFWRAAVLAAIVWLAVWLAVRHNIIFGILIGAFAVFLFAVAFVVLLRSPRA